MDQNQPLFMPARVGRAGEDVALQIEAAIIGGKIPPGGKLPSERKLQEQLKTGRGVIREAIRALQQKGLVEIKKGAHGGAFVKQLDVTKVSESLSLFLRQSNVSPDHLIEFRESIDRTITILAITRAGEKEKQWLLSETVRLQNYAAQDHPDMDILGEIDRELNVYLAQMTGNPVFEWIMKALQLGFSSYDHMLYQNPAYRKKTVDNWRETASCIAANEPLKALGSISNHYIFLRQCLQNEESPTIRPESDSFWGNEPQSNEVNES